MTNTQHERKVVRRKKTERLAHKPCEKCGHKLDKLLLTEVEYEQAVQRLPERDEKRPLQAFARRYLSDKAWNGRLGYVALLLVAGLTLLHQWLRL